MLYLALSKGGEETVVLPLLLLKERVAKLSELRRNPKKILKGFVRLVSDERGLKTNGFFLDKAAFEDLLETLEYSSPEFWKEIEASRKSGRVSEKSLERNLPA